MNLMRVRLICLILLLIFSPVPTLRAQTPDQPTPEQLKAQIEALKAEYAQRIKALEDQVEQLQVQMLQAPSPEEAAAAAPQQPAVQSFPGALNPAIAVATNFVSRVDSHEVFNADGNRIDNKLNLREGELDLRVPVDPYADAVLITSFESETPGEFSTDIEEGYVTIKKLPFLDHPPAGLKLKIGRFRPDFGKSNILHTHDLPQTFRSLPTAEFMGEDGFNQNGISANFFLPSPDSNSTLDATLQVLTGGDIAISPDLRSAVSYLGHIRWFRTFADVNNVEVGWSSYFHPSANGVDEADFHGVDFLYRWKPIRRGEWKSYLLGGEVMFARRAYPEAAEPPDVARAIEMEGLDPGQGKPVGYTVFNQWQFNRRIYAGLRWDQTDTLFNPDLSRRSITPYLSYYFSEFLRFRVDYEHRWSDLATENGRNSLYFELNWIFGAHPPEPFWVNK